MLWIHGGAFILGDTLGYDGSVLATEGNVVVVTAAYRLGVFGFLSSSSDNLKGNYGMLDQIAAMKWVNKNIARFGGDPNKVTIFGGSAGGMCVALLILSPLASGLYQNVIMQSGTAAAISSAKERNEADLPARSFAKAAGCKMTSLKACVKTKSSQEVLDAQSQVFSNPILLPFGPVVDGYFLPDSPVKLLQAGKFNKSNIIVGVAREDGSIFITGVKGVLKGVNVSNGMPRPLFKEEIRKRTWLRYQDSQVLQLLVYEYTDWSNATDLYVLRQQFIEINSDATFKAPAIKSAKAFVKEGSPTYFYQLEMAPRVYPAIPFPTPPWLGVYHRADVFYTFGVPLVMAENLQTVAEVRLSKDIMTFWSNFAKTGNPNTPTPVTVTWPQYTANHEEYLGLSANLTVRFKMRPGKMALWNELLPLIEETIRPTASSHIPTTSAKAEDGKDTIVMILAILTGVLAAAVVILLVVLILKRKRRRRDFEQPLNM